MANQYINALTDLWNDGGTTYYGIRLTVTDSASASNSKLIDLLVGATSMFNVSKAGVVTAGGGLLPSANDGGALGSASLSFSDLFLASGAVINLANGDVTITHSANALAFAGASSGYSFSHALLPSANDGAALGASGTAWSDLFLATGAVINFAAGGITITETSDALAFAGAANGYTFSHALLPSANDGAALGAAATAWSDAFFATGAVLGFGNGNYTVTHSSGILTFSGVLAAASTIELGHASDTTLSRSAAGLLAVEGNLVPSPGSQSTGDILVRGASSWSRLAIGTAGQVPRVNSGATALEYADKITSGTSQATTSGTSKDFTSIPSWVKRITLNLAGVSTNGSDAYIVQIGDSGGIETTGYLGSGGNLTSGGFNSNFTAGFGLMNGTSASDVLHGRVILELLDASTNTWTATAHLTASNTSVHFFGTGSKSLSATLDRIRLTTSGGANTFDAGSVNILYE